VKLNNDSIVLKSLGIGFRILCGSLFIFSAYTKLFPIEYFEYQLVGDHLANWTTSGYLSRLLISFEFFLGVSLLISFDYKQLIVRSAFFLTSIFTIYLLVVLAIKGNEPNCNCFGEVIKMSVVSSLIKNTVLLVVLMFIWKSHNGYSLKFPKIIISSLLVISIATVFIVNPINKTFANAANNDFKNFKMDLGFLYTDSIYIKPQTDLMKGKHIIAFLSLTCPHCRLAALKFGVITKENPEFPIYFILNGDSAKIKPFYEETKSENIPSNIVKGNSFIELSGLSLPAIYFVKDGIVEKRENYLNITNEMITNWLLKKN